MAVQKPKNREIVWIDFDTANTEDMEGMDIDNMDDHEVDMLLESADVDWNKSLNVTKLGVVGRNEAWSH